MRIPKRLMSVFLAGVIAAASVSAFTVSGYAAGQTDIEARHGEGSEAFAETDEGFGEVNSILAAPSGKAGDSLGAEADGIVAAPVVGNVRNIEKTSFEPDYITLKWDKVSGASGYAVYYLDVDSSNSYKKYTDVTSNTVTVKNLSHTTQYYFKIAAYINQGGKRYEGNATVKKTATQPGRVTGLDSVRSSDVLEFEWNRNPKATGYKIYRACAKTDAEYVLYATIRNNKTTSFSDRNVEEGRAYYYRVYAFRELYGGSYTSTRNEIYFISGLCAPNYTMTSQVSRVSLSWNHNRYAHGYDIYYSTSRNSGWSKLGSTTRNFFNTVRLTDGKTYYFRVQPYKINGGSRTKVDGTYATKYKTVTEGAYGSYVGGTYIEVSLKQQHIWLYKNRKLITEEDVVTGNDDGYHNTPKGLYSVYQRSSPATLSGPGYTVSVNYWMGFYGGYGIHDSTWRPYSDYGGSTYKGDGSHGCVNTPYSCVRTIYNNTGYGTKVVIY